MSATFRWGFLGTGMIAEKFASGIFEEPRSVLCRVGSRDRDRAQAFVERMGQGRAGTYEEVLEDPEVDGVYVALPNHLHAHWSIAALRAGKHVLCEKPIAMNRQEAEGMFGVAEETGKVLIEAYMYPLAPINQQWIQMALSGRVGRLRTLRVDFAFNRPVLQSDARYHPEMGGGALMDVGCYCLHVMRTVTGEEPCAVQAMAHVHESGVDDAAVATLRFPSGTLGVLSCGMTVPSDIGLTLSGSEGFIKMEWPWKGESGFAVYENRMSEPECYEPEPGGLSIYAREAAAFAAASRREQRPWISMNDSLGNMRALDALRASLE